MTVTELCCWKCGTAFGDIPLPLGRLAKCRGCNADLHVCRMCNFYDRTVSKQCREPIAEEVQNKTRSNFCGYLQPRPGAYTAGRPGKARAAKSELDAIFGMPSGEDDKSTSDPDEAKRKLDQLFGLDKK